MENELLDRPASELFHTTRGPEAYPKEVVATVAASRAEMDKEDSNGRSIKPAIPHANARRFQPSFRQHVPPPRWAVAFEQYVSGTLASFEQVAKFLSINPKSVARRAILEKWTDARDARAKAVMEQVRQGPRLELQASKEALEELGAIQTTIAKSLLSHGPAIETLRVKVMEGLARHVDKLDNMTAMEAAMPATLTRIEALTALSESLLEQVRVLAGLPEPGRMSAKPSQATAPVQSHDPAMFQPVGLADDGGGGGS